LKYIENNFIIWQRFFKIAISSTILDKSAKK